MITRRGGAVILAIACAAATVTAKEPRRAAPAAPAAARDTSGETLSQVLSRFDEVQGQIRTLSAQFVQTTHNPILKDPIIAKGRFCLTKPDSVLWEYTSPEPMRFVVAGGEYTGYFPDRKRVERRDIKRWSEQLFRFFGLGQGSSELEKFYEITLGNAADQVKDCYLLVLTPKKRRVKKNVEEVKLWVDTSTLLPVKIDYFGKDGADREISFLNALINPDLAASLYKMDIPKDVSISSGFSGFDVSASPSH
jgi:outer membrane lipoprotein-sorting protein